MYIFQQLFLRSEFKAESTFYFTYWSTVLIFIIFIFLKNMRNSIEPH